MLVSTATAVRGMAGLGDPNTILGRPIQDYCSDTVLWATNAYCWPRSPSAWSQMKQFAQAAAGIPLPKPVPAVTDVGFPSTGAPSLDVYQSSVDAAITDSAQQTQADRLSYFQNLLPVMDTSGNGSTWLLIALGAAAVIALLFLARRI